MDENGLFYPIRNEQDKDGRKIVLAGYTKGKKCKDCARLYFEHYSKKYYRCELYPKKNWKVNTDACIYFKPKRGVKE